LVIHHLSSEVGWALAVSMVAEPAFEPGTFAASTCNIKGDVAALVACLVRGSATKRFTLGIVGSGLILMSNMAAALHPQRTAGGPATQARPKFAKHTWQVARPPQGSIALSPACLPGELLQARALLRGQASKPPAFW
jgi:hypothetical protein